MAVGEGKLPELAPVSGFKLGTTSAGIKTEGRKDLVVMEIAEGGTVAGVFTKNAFCAAPVQVAKKNLAAISPRYLLVNTGNANAGTGEQGLKDAVASCTALAGHAGCDESEVLPFSTGVIGEPLPMDKLLAAIPSALAQLSESGWSEAAFGIMTTDTRPKGASRTVSVDGQEFVVTGIAKGAGMIKPNMATMLGYIATDAAIEPELLQSMLEDAVNRSFNRITVDGDTSTNDACMLVATGAAKNPLVASAEGEIYLAVKAAIDEVALELAHALVRDGEGAGKFVAVEVVGAQSEQEAVQVGYTVAESPLVKTALFASDPNWGRILAAIGRSGIDALDVDGVKVAINGVVIAENGGRAASYTEERGVAAMEPEEITIRIDLARGEGEATIWTTDLSLDYVRINAEYRT